MDPPPDVNVVAAPSEAISQKWIEGAERICRRCDAPIKNLQRDVGEVGTDTSGQRFIICMGCHTTRSQWLGSKTPPLYVGFGSST